MKKIDSLNIISFTKVDVYENFEFIIHEEVENNNPVIICDMEETIRKYPNKNIAELSQKIQTLNFKELESLPMSIGLFDCCIDFSDGDFFLESGSDNVFIAVMDVCSNYLNDQIYIERAKEILDMDMYSEEYSEET